MCGGVFEVCRSGSGERELALTLLPGPADDVAFNVSPSPAKLPLVAPVAAVSSLVSPSSSHQLPSIFITAAVNMGYAADSIIALL